jgi:cytochrome P450
MAGAVDLNDLDMWALGVPYDEFARLRREAPVAWHDEPAPNSGFWSVHRYADIVTASRDVATFSSARGISFEEPTEADMAARRTIIDTDPPDHTKLRKIVSGSFSQRAVAVYQHFVEGLTEQVLDAGLAEGELEFVDAVAKDVPIRVLARIMGLPQADLDEFIDLGDRLIANTDPDITDVVWGRDDTDAFRRFPFRSPYGKQLWDLGRGIVRDRLRAPGDDLLSTLLRAEVDGDRLSEVDLDNFFSILVVAGNETTRIAIAQGVLAFCEHPEQWARLRANPGLLGTAADEVLRWTCPTHFMRRTAARDTEFGGAAIRAGDKVVLWYVSGNRDEAEFADPDVFDVGRAPNRHLSFGRGGPHLCLGVHLARLEVRVVLGALARRVERFELAGQPRRIRSNFTNGLRDLPVRVHLAAPSAHPGGGT